MQYVSAPDASPVTSPPEGWSLSESLRVRSGLIGAQLCPWSADRNNMFPAAYNTPGSCGENWMGYVHWNLYRASTGPKPVFISGQTVMILTCPVE